VEKAVELIGELQYNHDVNTGAAAVSKKTRLQTKHH